MVNDSRVFPARLRGHKSTGGAVEALLVEPAGGDELLWRCLCRSSKGIRAGMVLHFPPDVEAEVTDVGSDGEAELRFRRATGTRDAAWFADWVDETGEPPLPPYVRRPVTAGDRARYQTIYARTRGSVAAPTAGLHFTAPLLAALEARGIERVALTLHVGPGTFRPVRSEAVADHRMEAERVTLPAETAAAVLDARASDRRVVAVGTTTVRALEGITAARGGLEPGSHRVSLFIRPGHRFRVVDGLLTNFHLPRSTLIMLVSAFAGRERTLAAYRHAVGKEYRFYSYGDAMLIR